MRAILTHPATLFITAAVTSIVGAISLWNHYHPRLAATENFALSKTQIQLSAAAPEWTQIDLAAELHDQFQDASLLDTHLVKATADYLNAYGWIEGIQSIEKSSAGLDIRLSYRHPVAMVQVGQKQLLPIDRAGVILDQNLIKPSQDPKFLRISMFRPLGASQRLHHWQPWPDHRIQKAALIGDCLQSCWQELALARIVTFHYPPNPSDQSVEFELWTAGYILPSSVSKTPATGMVIWGKAPGFEEDGEALAATKIQAIKRFIDSRGPLYRSIPKNHQLDVRSGKPILTSKVRSAEQIGFIDDVTRR